MSYREQQSPDVIAHRLVTNIGAPVRVYLQANVATIPTEPYRGDGPPDTATVPVAYFDAVIEHAEIVDGGLNLFGVNGLHLPTSEWRRIGLQKHWEANDADLQSPFFPPHRHLEVWASRENNLHEDDSNGFTSNRHLEEIPNNSPLIKEWQTDSTDDDSEKPPVPLSRPTVSVDTVHAEDITEAHGFDRVEVGAIRNVVILDEIREWPTDTEIPTREIPDQSLAPRHPDIEYDALESLSLTDQLLMAIRSINRHAKGLAEEADSAYHRDEGIKARRYSIRKLALYRVKTIAIHRLAKANPENVTLERHVLNGETESVCFYFGDKYSFHQPPAAVEEQLLRDVGEVSSVDELPAKEITFERNAETDELKLTLNESLKVLAEVGLNANEFLDDTCIEDFDGGYAISTRFTILDKDYQPH